MDGLKKLGRKLQGLELCGTPVKKNICPSQQYKGAKFGPWFNCAVHMNLMDAARGLVLIVTTDRSWSGNVIHVDFSHSEGKPRTHLQHFTLGQKIETIL